MSNGHMSDLRTLTPGLADPAHDAQQLFRAILDATSHPGRIVSLPAAPAGPGALSAAATAYLLTLADRDTPVWLASEFDRPEVRDFLRFHAGAPIVAPRADAVFAVLASGTPQPLEGFNLGTDAYPDRSATLIVEVADLRVGRRGSGVARASTAARLSPLRVSPTISGKSGPPTTACFPCGVDIVFTAGTELCALPRSVAVEV